MIRPLRPSDLPQVTVIYNEIVETGEYFYMEFPVDEVKMLERLSVPGRETFVLEEDGEILGFYFINKLFEGRSSHVANCAYSVAKKARGKKVGQRMAEHSIQYAKENGFRSIAFVAVVATNTIANALWKKLGFRLVGSLHEGHRSKDGTFVDTNIYQLQL